MTHVTSYGLNNKRCGLRPFLYLHFKTLEDAVHSAGPVALSAMLYSLMEAIERDTFV